MSVGRGEVFGFLGPNGAGKTTTVKLLLGLARSDRRPTAKVLGAPLGDLGATRRKVGYLPELFRYQPWLKAHEVLDAPRASSLAMVCPAVGAARPPATRRSASSGL